MKKEKQKFKPGDLVLMSEKLAEYILSDYGQEAYFPPSGILDAGQELTHNNNTVLALLVAIGAPPIGIISTVNYPNTQYANCTAMFNIGFGPFGVNIAFRDLELLWTR